jgi:glycosyltransferase involved in cell wall biosynthesis
MTICFICCEYPPALHGGIGSYIQTLGRALVRSGDRVRVAGIYPAHESALEYEEDQGVEVWRFRSPAGRLGWIAARYRLFRTLARWAAEGEIDLIEVPDWEGHAALWPRLAVPVVARLHGSSAYFSVEMEYRQNPRSFWLEARSFHRADYCCSVSAYTAAKTGELFGRRREPAAVLYCPVELSGSSRPAQRDPHSVVFAGSLTRKKGIIQLIRAWPLVLAEAPEARLDIYGKDARTDDGRPMQPFLESLLEGTVGASVAFHGHVRTEQLRNIYRACQVGVFPSYSEAFSLAPVEAMAEGCPVVYSTRHSGPELIKDEVNGLLVDPDDVAALARSILRLLAADTLAGRIGEAGRAHVRQMFSADRMREKNRAFYAQCIGSFARHGRAHGVTHARASSTRDSVEAP